MKVVIQTERHQYFDCALARTYNKNHQQKLTTHFFLRLILKQLTRFWYRWIFMNFSQQIYYKKNIQLQNFTKRPQKCFFFPFLIKLSWTKYTVFFSLSLTEQMTRLMRCLHSICMAMTLNIYNAPETTEGSVISN